jgi:hypothetical protein
MPKPQRRRLQGTRMAQRDERCRTRACSAVQSAALRAWRSCRRDAECRVRQVTAAEGRAHYQHRAYAQVTPAKAPEYSRHRLQAEPLRRRHHQSLPSRPPYSRVTFRLQSDELGMNHAAPRVDSEVGLARHCYAVERPSGALNRPTNNADRQKWRNNRPAARVRTAQRLQSAKRANVRHSVEIPPWVR